jgi:hypothetical protein
MSVTEVCLSQVNLTVDLAFQVGLHRAQRTIGPSDSLAKYHEEQ